MGGHRRAYLVREARAAVQDRALARLGNVEERRKEQPRAVFVFGADFARYARKYFALAGGIRYRKPLLALRFGDVAHDFETLEEKLRELVVYAVDFAARVRHAHVRASLILRTAFIVTAN